jgi:hypothetical protein
MNFNYETSFSFIVRPLVSEEKDKYLAIASSKELSEFIPNIDTEKNIDLLPIAFNAAVVNRVNKNGDVIDSQSAASIYKDFINKPINVEHNREKIIGVILTAGFSEFGSDIPLTEDQVKDLKGPYNITLGGVIWKIANPNLANTIEDSADSSSQNYQKISASWELGFNEYNLVAIEGESKNIEDGIEISDPKEVDTLKCHLKALGGSGRVNKTQSLYRKVVGKVVPLGIGITEAPAADVKGIVTDKMEASMKIIEENISKNPNLNVNSNTKEETMKINSAKDITEETLKQITASQIADFIEQELKTASEQFAAEKSSVETALKAAQENHQTLLAEHTALKDQVSTLKNSLETAQAEMQKAAAAETFNARMSAFDQEYDLDSDTRQILANDIANLDDESFAAYKNKMAVFMKGKKKDIKTTDQHDNFEGGKGSSKNKDDEMAEKKQGKQDDEKKEESKKDMKSKASSVIEAAIDRAEKPVIDIPITSTASEDSFYAKYKKAFDYDGFIVK